MLRALSLRLAVPAIFLAALAGCSRGAFPAESPRPNIALAAIPIATDAPDAPRASRVAEAPPGAIEARAAEAIRAIKNRDMAALAALAHPTKGVRFSPYSFVDTTRDVTLSRAEIRGALRDDRVRTWGTYDGEGSPINLRFADYLDQFVYDADFERAPRISVDRAPAPGNAPDNAAFAYPSGTIVEHYFPGFNPAYEGMDWRSLKLVFEREGGALYLVGVVHAQWMI